MTDQQQVTCSNCSHAFRIAVDAILALCPRCGHSIDDETILDGGGVSDDETEATEARTLAENTDHLETRQVSLPSIAGQTIPDAPDNAEFPVDDDLPTPRPFDDPTRERQFEAPRSSANQGREAGGPIVGDLSVHIGPPPLPEDVTEAGFDNDFETIDGLVDQPTTPLEDLAANDEDMDLVTVAQHRPQTSTSDGPTEPRDRGTRARRPTGRAPQALSGETISVTLPRKPILERSRNTTGPMPALSETSTGISPQSRRRPTGALYPFAHERRRQHKHRIQLALAVVGTIVVVGLALATC